MEKKNILGNEVVRWCTRFNNSKILSLSLNKYLCRLELEFTTPECHLPLIGHRKGILGNPKYLFDTMLNLNEQMLKKTKWNEGYDPYSLIKRVFIEIHTSDDFVERFDH